MKVDLTLYPEQSDVTWKNRDLCLYRLQSLVVSLPKRCCRFEEPQRADITRNGSLYDLLCGACKKDHDIFTVFSRVLNVQISFSLEPPKSQTLLLFTIFFAVQRIYGSERLQ